MNWGNQSATLNCCGHKQCRTARHLSVQWSTLLRSSRFMYSPSQWQDRFVPFGFPRTETEGPVDCGRELRPSQLRLASALLILHCPPFVVTHPLVLPYRLQTLLHPFMALVHCFLCLWSIHYLYHLFASLFSFFPPP
jgi:hypothetical protein